MTRLFMDLEQLNDQAGKLITKSKEMKDAANELARYIKIMPEVWQGQSANEFISKIQGTIDTLTTAADPLDQLGHRIYREIEEWANADLARRFDASEGAYLDDVSGKLGGNSIDGLKASGKIDIKNWLRDATFLPWWLRYPDSKRSDYYQNPIFGTWVKHTVESPQIDLSLGVNNKPGDGLLFGLFGDTTAYKEKWENTIFGDKNFGMTTGLVFTAGQAGGMLGAKVDSDGNVKVGGEVGASAASVDFKLGFNIAGVNVGINIGFNLGGTLGFGWDEGPKAKLGLFNLGLDLKEAKDTAPPP